MQYLINQSVSIPFTSIGLTTGKTVFTPYFILNGAISAIVPTYTEVGGGVYLLHFTPTSSGVLSIFIEGYLLSPMEIVGKLLNTTIQNLEDSSLGSWTWDKVAGVMSLLRQDGSVLANFNVVDTITNASKERV